MRTPTIEERPVLILAEHAQSVEEEIAIIYVVDNWFKSQHLGTSSYDVFVAQTKQF
jgi:hypothetical protein